MVCSRGGVKNTTLEAKDTKNSEAIDRPFRGQGHKKILRLGTDLFEAKDTGASVLKKKVFKIFFQAVSQKVFANFLRGFLRFPTKFQRFQK